MGVQCETRAHNQQSMLGGEHSTATSNKTHQSDLTKNIKAAKRDLQKFHTATNIFDKMARVLSKIYTGV
jgi:hypothetical protein